MMTPEPSTPSKRDLALRFRIQTLQQLKPILQSFRKYAGMTQSELANKLGITQQSYAQLEAYPERASVERLFVVLAILGVELYLDGGNMSAPLAIGRTGSKKAVAPPAVKPRAGDTTKW